VRHGEEEEPLPEMRGSAVERGENIPRAIEPERGQIADQLVKASPSVNCEQPGHIFNEHGAGLDLGDDPGNVGPEPALIERAAARSGGAGGLAREARREEIHDAAPRSAIEGREIVPDRRAIQRRVFHPCHEDGRCVGVPLNVTHASVRSAEREGHAEFQSSSAGT
jgi:hypothetical protein